MGLAEAHNAETFRAGVCERLESRGEQVGFREIVAHIPVSYSTARQLLIFALIQVARHVAGMHWLPHLSFDPTS